MLRALRLILLVTALSPALATAQTAGAPSQTLIGPLTNCNATNITVAKDCEIRLTSANPPINGTWGYNVLTLNIFYDWGTSGTGFTFTLQGCHEGMDAASCTDATDWYTIAGDNFASGTGVLTVKEATATYAAAADAYVSWTIGINQMRMRLHNVTANAGTADKVTVRAILTRTGAF